MQNVAPPKFNAAQCTCGDISWLCELNEATRHRSRQLGVWAKARLSRLVIIDATHLVCNVLTAILQQTLARFAPRRPQFFL